MNCPNCGAAMELVESRRYLRCRHCGTYDFPEPIDADGIRIVGQTAEAIRCPVCAAPMAHALLDQREPIDFCGRCRGVLLPRTTFATAIARRRAWAATPPVEPLPLNRHELHRKIRCPKCQGHFDTYPHYGPGNVVIDNCTACDVIWLDFGEMRQIVDAPGKDRGVTNPPPLDEEIVRRQHLRDADAAEDDSVARPPTDLWGFLIGLMLDR